MTTRTTNAQLCRITLNSTPSTKTTGRSEMAFLSNSMWQNRKERPNRSTNNEDMTETAKCYVVCE